MKYDMIEPKEKSKHKCYFCNNIPKYLITLPDKTTPVSVCNICYLKIRFKEIK